MISIRGAWFGKFDGLFGVSESFHVTIAVSESIIKIPLFFL